MHYKTIVFKLLQQHPTLHEQLRRKRILIGALDHYSGILKERHEVWKESLSRGKPQSDPSQVASEALEIALKELEDRLRAESPADETDSLSLDAAMAFLHRYRPPR